MRRLISNSGFTIVEVLAASTIALVSALGLSWSVAELGKNRIRAEAISGLTAIESALTEQLQLESNYRRADRPDIITSLQAGNVPANWVFTVRGAVRDLNFVFNISPNAGQNVVFLSPTFERCGGYPSDACTYRVELSLSTGAQSGEMAFGYKLSSANLTGSRGEEIKVNYKGGGTESEDPSVMNFALPIPYEYYLSDLNLACQPASQFLGVTGIDREQGLVNCIPMPEEACANGTLPKRLRSVNTDGRNRIEFQCGPPAQQVFCPQHYSLNTLDTTSLDAGAAKSGMCVHTSRRIATYPTPFIGKRVTGTVCPERYRSISTCTLTNVQQQVGYCQPWCNSSVCTGQDSWENWPVGSGRYTGVLYYGCGDTTPMQMNPNPGNVVLTNNGRDVDCYVRIPNQDCGASWDADAQVNVICELIEPETAGVQ